MIAYDFVRRPPKLKHVFPSSCVLFKANTKNFTKVAHLYLVAHWLWDRSEKHGEALCVAFVPDLQRIARTAVERCIIADSPD